MNKYLEKIKENPFLVLENYDTKIDDTIKSLEYTQRMYLEQKTNLLVKKNEIETIKSKLNGNLKINLNNHKDIILIDSLLFPIFLTPLSIFLTYILNLDFLTKDYYLIIFLILPITLFFIGKKIQTYKTLRTIKRDLKVELGQKEKLEMTYAQELVELSNQYSLLCKKISNEKSVADIVTVLKNNLKTEISQIQTGIDNYFRWDYSYSQYRISGDIDNDIHYNNGTISIQYIHFIREIILQNKYNLDLNKIYKNKNIINYRIKHKKELFNEDSYSEWSDKKLAEEWENF